MPYRIDFRDTTGHAFDRLIDLGALDVESSHGNQISALLPDAVRLEQLTAALTADDIAISPAIGRDADSVWVLQPRPVAVGRLRIGAAEEIAQPGTLRLADTSAFGTGLHPTTALCIEVLDEIVANSPVESVLDVGTGSGVLALGALVLGVPRAFAIDVDEDALRVTAEHARINGLADRLELASGGPESISGTWPLVLANVLAAPLIEMAPVVVRRVSHHGRLVLSGIREGVENEVEDPYRRLGMRRVDIKTRGGWIALAMQATW